LEVLPDYPADTPGATRKEQASRVIERVPPDTRLPDKLRVSLGRSIRLGDLEVTPLRVEMLKVVFCSEAPHVNPEPSRDDALVLTLRLHNVSEDDYFVPTDPAFTAQWREGEAKPYTFLEVGPQRFYGGPFPWQPRGRRGAYRDPDPREYVRGQEDDARILKPNQERTTVVCTDPADHAVAAAVRDYEGTLVWRVRLRRGLVAVGDREVSSSGVIGVQFDARQVRRPGP
jgi:hypothetical protein